MPQIGPQISTAMFCERVDEDERGVKSFIGAMDTLKFSSGSTETQMVWKGALEIGLVFGDEPSVIELEMVQLEVSNGDRQQGLKQSIDSSEFPGMFAASLTLEITMGFERVGVYWYEFFLDGQLKTRVPLTVRAV